MYYATSHLLYPIASYCIIFVSCQVCATFGGNHLIMKKCDKLLLDPGRTYCETNLTTQTHLASRWASMLVTRAWKASALSTSASDSCSSSACCCCGSSCGSTPAESGAMFWLPCKANSIDFSAISASKPADASSDRQALHSTSCHFAGSPTRKSCSSVYLPTGQPVAFLHPASLQDKVLQNDANLTDLPLYKMTCSS